MGLWPDLISQFIVKGPWLHTENLNREKTVAALPTEGLNIQAFMFLQSCHSTSRGENNRFDISYWGLWIHRGQSSRGFLFTVMDLPQMITRNWILREAVLCVRLTWNFHMHRIVQLRPSAVVTMTTADPPNGLWHRNVKAHQSDELSNHSMVNKICTCSYAKNIVYKL